MGQLKNSISLSDQVSASLENYFKNLQGQTTCDLYETVIQQVEKPLIEAVLKHNDYNQSQTAIMLGINRNTLRKKMLKYQLTESNL